MTTDEFFDSCIADVMMIMGGYNDRMNDQWAIARYHAYLLYCTVTEPEKRATIYDFHPLPNDPPADERPLTARDRLFAAVKATGKKVISNRQ